MVLCRVWSAVLVTLAACGAPERAPVVYDPPLRPSEMVGNFHPNGVKMSEGVMRDGREEGPWTYWHDNARKMSEGVFVNSRQVGLWTTWDAAGKIESRGEYRDGLREGVWTFWLVDGLVDIEQSGTYRAGERNRR